MLGRVTYWFGYGLWALLSAGMLGGLLYKGCGWPGAVVGAAGGLWLAWRFR